MKAVILVTSILLFTKSVMGWGPDIVPAAISPQGKSSVIAKDVTNLFAAIPSTSNTAFSILVFQSIDGGSTWNAASFTGAGPGGGAFPVSIKSIQTMNDSVYSFYLTNGAVYSTNLEPGFTSGFTLDTADEVDVAASTVTNSSYLCIQDQRCNCIPRYG